MELHYRPPGPVARAFLKDDSFFTGIQGPVGSGKSSAACMKIMKAATEIPPGPDGIRRSRWAVIRNTYPELKTTTIETWLEWFPEKHFGRFIWTPPFTHALRFADVEMDVLFLALDSDQDIGKLLSLDLTGAWINEAREIPKAVLDATTLRLGRYPPRRDVDTFWYGVIADTNAPAEDHWFAIMSGQSPVPEHFSELEAAQMVKPEDWSFHIQPGAVIEQRDKAGRTSGWTINDKAENLDALPKHYYKQAMTGKDSDYIRVFIGNRIGSARGGKPVYHNFSNQIHVGNDDLMPDPRLPIIMGIDFGLTPAVIFAQRYVDGSFFVFDELTSRDMGLVQLATQARDRLVKWERLAGGEFAYRAWGDPAGDARAASDEFTRNSFQILASHGISARPAHTNDPVMRIEAVDYLLTSLLDGRPLITVAPRCRVLIRGFEEGYRYKKKPNSQAMVGTETTDKPDKNQFSHPHDALQYLVLGEGVGKELKRRQRINSQPVVARKPWNPYDRQIGARDRTPRLRKQSP